ncbi:DnaJ domain protein [Ceratobasidium sp. AG-Ba]|nr:DnaJ domain protein [Ceratobasidium sp. AG-Ba]
MLLGTFLRSPIQRSPFATAFTGISLGPRSPNIVARSFGYAQIRRATHYDTLGVPHNATKGQIKASFYGLSKKYHPDVNPETKDKFLAVNEAYATLNDDRLRRTYDRTLASSSTINRASPDVDYAWSNDPSLSRRPRATHAWESPRRHRAGHFEHGHHPHQRTSGAYTHASPHARRATGGQGGYSHIPREDPNSPLSRLQRDSGIWRIIQVFGLLWVVLSLTGLTVHAGKG